MDKITKFLKRLNRDERETLERILQQVRKNSLSGLDVRKLKGDGGLFRVRSGSVRIIFQKKEGTTKIISVDRRSEDTYKNL